MSESHPTDAARARSPVVSAIVINYHAYDELAECLASLVEQTLAALEIIVIDHDSSPTACQALAARFPSVRFVSLSENPGFAAGVNRGASIAGGRYLYLLNPDATADRDVCRALSAWLDEQPQVGVVGSLVRDADGAIQASARRFPDVTTALGGRTTWLTRLLPSNPLTKRNLLTGSHVQQPVDVDWVSGASMMIRHTAFDAIGGMDAGFFLYWEDADFCRRLADAGWRTAYYPAAGVTHLCGRSSRSSASSISAFHDSVFRYVRKHGGAVSRLAAPLIFVGLKARLLGVLWLNRRRP
jgi:N-acetylglucosaminyl-diphospho-decaprenol L-rhamnosyltransferase